MKPLEGKVTLIVGAKGGLGSFVTEAFLAAGARVAGVSRSIQQSDFPDPNFIAMPANLASGEVARQLAADVISRCGRIDALVHVMGGFAGGQSVADTDDATFEQMIDVNCRAAFFMARAVLAADAPTGQRTHPRGGQPPGRRAGRDDRRLQRFKGGAGGAD